MDIGNPASFPPDRDEHAEPGIRTPSSASGFYRFRTSVFYATGDGRVFLVSTPDEQVCLRPRDELPVDAVRTVGITDAAFLLVADTAEQLGSPNRRHLRADVGRDARVMVASLLQDLLDRVKDTIGRLLLDEQSADIDGLHEQVDDLVMTSRAHRRRLDNQRINSRGQSPGLSPPPPSTPRLAIPFWHRGEYVGWFIGMAVAGEALGVASVRDAHLRGDLWTVSHGGILHVFRCRARTLTHTAIGPREVDRPPATVEAETLHPPRREHAMTTDGVSLMDPLPLFHHVASGRVFYTAGTRPFVFSISLTDVSRNAPVADRGPAEGEATHPFGHSTRVASLASSITRRELAEATILPSSALDTRLGSWVTFCDEVADRLDEGEPLEKVLNETWVLGESDDVPLDDDPPAVSAGSLQ